MLHIIKPIPELVVILSIFSLKNIKPKRVAKINFVKSNGIRLVNVEREIAFVQKKFPNVATIAMERSMKIIKKEPF